MPASIRGLLVAFVAELCDTACVNTQGRYFEVVRIRLARWSLTCLLIEVLYCERAAAAELLNATQALAQDPPFSERNHARVSLLALVKRAHEEMAKGGKNARGWRRIYTDTSVVLAFDAVFEFWSSQDEAFAFSAISHLDHAIVIAGAPGEGRLDLVFDLIEGVQSECLGVPPSLRRKRSFEATSISAPNTVLLPVLSAQNEISNPETPPSISSFISRLSQQPFVLPRYLSDWPALNEHPWSSVDYLRSIAGPGRVVPVEVGSDYRNDDWTQTMMPWDEFLGSLVESPLGAAANPVLYLAQHNLFTQFPSLKDDILVPDYVYCELDPPPNYPLYVPPANEHRLVLNAWLGPKGTVSPAHTVSFHTSPTLFTQAEESAGSFLQLLWYGSQDH